MNKYFKYTVLMSVMFLFFIIPINAKQAKMLDFTLDELANYNGKNGKPVYIAVEGLVYDFSSSKLWKNGMHKFMHEAGQDLTLALLKKSPHGKRVLERFPVVGKIVEKPVKK